MQDVRIECSLDSDWEELRRTSRDDDGPPVQKARQQRQADTDEDSETYRFSFVEGIEGGSEADGDGDGQGTEVIFNDDGAHAFKKRRRRICLGSLCLVILVIILAPSIKVPKNNAQAVASASNGPISEDEFQQLWATGCYQPSTCTDQVLDRLANGYTCRARMQWLMDVMGHSRWEACLQLATVEFPNICGPCNPSGDIPDDLEYLAELYCYQPARCTEEVLATRAGQYPCGERIQWLMQTQGESLGDACFEVAVNEFPVQCGGCDPTGGTGVYIPPQDDGDADGDGDGDSDGQGEPAVGGGGGGQANNGGSGGSDAGNDNGGNGNGDSHNGGNDNGNAGNGGNSNGGNSNGGMSNGSNFLLEPLSTLDPVSDLNMRSFNRPQASSPSGRLQTQEDTYPTNAWYQNMLHLRENEVPTNNHRAYPIPYVVDANGRIPGLRVHSFRNIASGTAVTLTVDEPFALTLGASEDIVGGGGLSFDGSKGYVVTKANELGLTLEWVSMKSSVVRGMPYATMTYSNLFQTALSGRRILPTIVADFPLQGSLLVDGSDQVDCSDGSQLSIFAVQNDIEISFHNGLTWMVFVSQAVSFQCSTSSGAGLLLQVSDLQGNTAEDFTMRLALIVPPVDSHGAVLPANDDFSTRYADLLREYAQVYPGQDASVSFTANSNSLRASIDFDWDATRIDGSAGDTSKLLTFALPHHQDKLATLDDFCTASLLGPVCLVTGSSWTISEELPDVSFRAPRRPTARHIPALAESLRTDINFRIPENFQIGAGDTYFGAKQMAKLARILLVADEVKEICSAPANEYRTVCQNSVLPSDENMDAAIGHLREVLDVWFGGSAEAPFVYDPAWGGVVSCGCYYREGHCTNAYPNCPAFVDQGLNFGNGFYNDHHFHYGYYIYASAVLAHFDPQWGRDMFETVLLLIRDIANPSHEDSSFPIFRHKDWYFGSSWASGITQPPFPNGMNQESSSEAIASYESVALFGRVMRASFDSIGQTTKAMAADDVHRIGLLLTATEIRSTQRYWHVSQTNDERSVYPQEYRHSVIGILWTTFVQFGTWFGNDPYLIYGIQLLPLTPISEERDNEWWAREVFGPLSSSCDQKCVSEGWSVQLLAILATIGHVDFAVNQAMALPSYVFRSAGGSGHSKSNTVWYLSTRLEVSEPFPFDENASYTWESALVQMNCGQPSSCTETVLDRKAGEFTCGERIRWLVNAAGLAQFSACTQIAVQEFPNECGACDPRRRRLGEG